MMPKDPILAEATKKKLSDAVKNSSEETRKKKSDVHKGKRKNKYKIENIKTDEFKKCSKCGIVKHKVGFGKCGRNKSGLQDWCKKCKSEHYIKNKEEISKHRKQYREENKELLFEQHKRYREENKEQIAIRKKNDYLNNKERYQQKSKEYYYKHRDVILKYVKEYAEEHREEKKEYDSKYRKTERGFEVRTRSEDKRRARSKLLGSPLTLKQWNKILKRQNYIRPDCERRFSKQLPPTKDHIIPISCPICPGLTYGNTQALCRSCNSKKNNNVEFLKAISELIMKGE